MGQRRRRPVGPRHRQRHPPGRAALAHQHELRALPATLQDDRQPLPGQRVERMSDNNRVRNRARTRRTGPMRGPSGCRAAGTCPVGPAWGCALFAAERAGTSWPVDPRRCLPGTTARRSSRRRRASARRRRGRHRWNATSNHARRSTSIRKTLVVEGVEATLPVLLGTAIQHALQGTNRVHVFDVADGPSRCLGTHQGPSLSTTRIDEAGALRWTGLCCPGRHRYYGPLRLPLGRLSLPAPHGYRQPSFPGHPGAEEDLSSSVANPLAVPRPLTPGSSSTSAPGSRTSSMAFAV